MHIVPTNLTVADYCKGLHDQSIIVNHDYQRSSKVWPVTAQVILDRIDPVGIPSSETSSLPNN